MQKLSTVYLRVTKFFSKDFRGRSHCKLAAVVFFRYSAGYDLAARRKNATRESTATLKAWLNEHKKNPYPTKGEKIMLAIITKMTLTQVSTWFANARRRLKKENKMTWEPKNKTDDDDDAVLSDSEDNKEKDDLAADNRGDRVGEEARRGLDDTGKFFFSSSSHVTGCVHSNLVKKYPENSLIFQVSLFKVPDKENIFKVFWYNFLKEFFLLYTFSNASHS